MKMTLTVSGGFTGVGGKWEIDAGSDAAQRRMGAGDLESLTQLIAQARAAEVFGKDYSAAPTAAGAPASAGPAGPIPADFQTYELEVNGERVRWREPAGASTAAAPPIVGQLKQRIMRNTPRQSYQPL